MYKIYKIVDNTNGNVYIGKTKQKYLCKRISGHRTDYKREKLCSSREIIKNGDYRVELIEETEDETRERYWIENTDCINKQIPNRTRKEYRKEYYEDNKDIIIEKNKEYYQNNKDIIIEKKKEYRENNKDIIIEKKRKYRENNKDKIKEYRENNKEKKKEYYENKNSWGGDPRFNNNLLKIDPNLLTN